jgi:hypothetical protein
MHRHVNQPVSYKLQHVLPSGRLFSNCNDNLLSESEGLVDIRIANKS